MAAPWFASRIERRIVLTLLAAVALPILGLTVYSLWELRAHSVETAERHLRFLAKQYGQQLIERLQYREEHFRRPGSNALTGASTVLRFEDDRLVLSSITEPDHSFSIGLDELLYDVGVLPGNLTRCVEVARARPSCRVGWPAEWSVGSYVLRLDSLFETDAQLLVHVSQPGNTMLANLTRTAITLPATIVLLATLACWFVLRLVRRQLAPLQELRRGADAVAEGDFDQHLEVAGGDELAEVASAFNEMARSVKSAVGTLATLADVDHLILAGATMDEVLTEVLALLQRLQIGPNLIVLEDDSLGPRCQVGLEDGALLRRPLPERTPEQDSMLAAEGEFPLLLDGKRVGALCVQQPVSRRMQARLTELAHRLSVALTNLKRNETLFEQANYDSLTGLYNRRAFIERLKDTIRHCERHNGEFALLFLDLDRFKAVNDTEGHSIGDSLLQLVAERLRRTSRRDDVLARLGGDEFALILRGSERAMDWAAACQRFLDALPDQVRINRLEHSLRASVGIAVYPRDGDNHGQLLRNADTAMYQAKALPDESFAFYDSSLHARTARSVMLLSRLRTALRDDLLHCVIQPQLDLGSWQISGAELLLRWDDPEAGTVPPAEFIPLAEESGLIQNTLAVLADAVAAVRAAEPAGRPSLPLSINLSPKQLGHAGFVESFRAELHSRGIDPGSLELEITESCLAAEESIFRDSLQALRRLGCRIALDDFGTGYSSLTLLNQLPIDVLKLDREFIRDIAESPRSQAMVARIIDLAKVLGMSVVAEGAEVLSELHLLRSLHCDAVQGYVVARPMPISDWQAFLRRFQTGAVRRAG